MKSVLLVIFAMTVGSSAYAEQAKHKGHDGDEHHHKRLCEMVTAPAGQIHGLKTTKEDMSCEECCHKLMLLKHGPNVSITCEPKHGRKGDQDGFCTKFDRDESEKWED